MSGICCIISEPERTSAVSPDPGFGLDRGEDAGGGAVGKVNISHSVVSDFVTTWTVANRLLSL